ncbi:hypothetical protein M569_11436, partial [Genlisea aurea]
RHHSYHHQLQVKRKGSSLQWLDLRVFYVRLSRCAIIDGETRSAPEFLTLNHVPMARHTLLEVNGSRTGLHSDGVSTLLKRDRLDTRSEEVTFVSTDCIRTTGSVKFEVFHKDVVVLSGTLDLHRGWSINCDDSNNGGIAFSKESRHHGGSSSSIEPPPPPAAIEVYVAGCFSDSPIVLTKTLQLSHRRKPTRKALTLESIPENETTRSDNSGHLLLLPAVQVNLLNNIPHNPINSHEKQEQRRVVMEYTEGEDGELSWFNAGVRVGVGIGLSICLGLGIGVGLLVRTYHGTTRNFTRRLL